MRHLRIKALTILLLALALAPFVATAAVSPTYSSVTSYPSNNVVADGSAYSTITVTVRDTSNAVMAGQTINYNVVGNSYEVSYSTLVSDTNGIVTMTITSTKAQVKTISASVGAVDFTNVTYITFIAAAVDAGHSTAVANPTTGVNADGVDSSTITATLKDVRDNLCVGRTVTLSASGGASCSSPAVTDASGVTTGTVTSTSSGTKTVTVVGDGVTLSTTPTVVFQTPVAPPSASLTPPPASPTNNAAADGSAYATILVTVRDTNNVAMTNKTVVLAASGTHNTLSTPAVTDTNGQTSATIRTTTAELKTITATVSSVTFTQQAAVTFIAPVVSATLSSVTASPTNYITADGTNYTTLTITIVETNGVLLANQTVTLSASGSGNTFSTPALTDTNGQTTATLSSTNGGTKTITASVGSVTITQQPVIIFIPISLPVSATLSTLTASPTNNVLADNNAYTTFSIHIVDLTNAPLAGKTVTLAVSGSWNVISSLALTDTNGKTTATMISSLAETKIAVASVGSVTITQQAAVVFIPVPIVLTCNSNNLSPIYLPGVWPTNTPWWSLYTPPRTRSEERRVGT